MVETAIAKMKSGKTAGSSSTVTHIMSIVFEGKVPEEWSKERMLQRQRQRMLQRQRRSSFLG